MLYLYTKSYNIEEGIQNTGLGTLVSILVDEGKDKEVYNKFILNKKLQVRCLKNISLYKNFNDFSDKLNFFHEKLLSLKDITDQKIGILLGSSEWFLVIYVLSQMVTDKVFIIFPKDRVELEFLKETSTLGGIPTWSKNCYR